MAGAGAGNMIVILITRILMIGTVLTAVIITDFG